QGPERASVLGDEDVRRRARALLEQQRGELRRLPIAHLDPDPRFALEALDELPDQLLVPSGVDREDLRRRGRGFALGSGARAQRGDAPGEEREQGDGADEEGRGEEGALGTIHRCTGEDRGGSSRGKGTSERPGADEEGVEGAAGRGRDRGPGPGSGPGSGLVAPAGV